MERSPTIIPITSEMIRRCHSISCWKLVKTPSAGAQTPTIVLVKCSRSMVMPKVQSLLGMVVDLVLDSVLELLECM